MTSVCTLFHIKIRQNFPSIYYVNLMSRVSFCVSIIMSRFVSQIKIIDLCLSCRFDIIIDDNLKPWLVEVSIVLLHTVVGVV